MKRVIGLTTLTTAILAIALIALLNQTVTVSLREMPFTRYAGLLAAAFLLGAAAATALIWFTWNARIAKRERELGKHGLEQSVATMRRLESQRLTLAAYGLDPRQQHD